MHMKVSKQGDIENSLNFCALLGAFLTFAVRLRLPVVSWVESRAFIMLLGPSASFGM